MFCALGSVFGSTEGVGCRFHVLRCRTCFRRYRGRRVSFSCSALLDSFSMVSRAPGPVFMYCAPELVLGGTAGAGSSLQVLCSCTRFRWYYERRVPLFMFCAHGLVFGGTEGVGFRFHVLRSRTHFRRYQGRRVPFSCCAHPDSFSVVPWASGPDCMFCAPGLIFDGTEGVGFHFHVLRCRTRFGRCRGRRV
jgi:hypothetical protein